MKVWKKRSTFAEKTMEYTFKQAEAADMCQRIIPQDWRSEVRWGGKVPSKAHRSCGYYANCQQRTRTVSSVQASCQTGYITGGRRISPTPILPAA